MRWTWLPLLLLCACVDEEKDLCQRFYAAYTNHIGERPRTASNGELLDGMAAYDRQDFTTAATLLDGVIAKDGSDNIARMYLASALLGSGEPYKAEMHLDFLERQSSARFKDQVEWYNALCWLCSGQFERALAGCAMITAQPAHTYTNEARDLSAALTGQ